MLVVRGRLEPEVGALLMQALAAARETLYQRARAAGGGGRGAETFPRKRPPWRSARPMPWPSSRRRRFITGLADPAQPAQSVLEDGVRVSAEPDMWRSPLPVDLKRRTIARGGWSRGRSRYWCRPSPTRNLTRGVARYPVVSPQRAL